MLSFLTSTNAAASEHLTSSSRLAISPPTPPAPSSAKRPMLDQLFAALSMKTVIIFASEPQPTLHEPVDVATSSFVPRIPFLSGNSPTSTFSLNNNTLAESNHLASTATSKSYTSYTTTSFLPHEARLAEVILSSSSAFSDIDSSSQARMTAICQIGNVRLKDADPALWKYLNEEQRGEFLVSAILNTAVAIMGFLREEDEW